MPSRSSTIKVAQEANRLAKMGKTKEQIAGTLGVSPSRVDEYLARNSHALSCEVCHGFGVRDRLSTGSKSPICSSD